MKKLILTIALLSGFAIAFAQSPLPLGQAQINAGVGFSDWGIPLYFGIDYSVHKDITIGGELSFRSYYDHYNNTEYRHGIMGISGNGNYHFNSIMNIPTDWDFYAGLNLGFYTWTSSTDYPGTPRNSGLWLGAQIGGRYYFSEKCGINLELGGGNATSGGKFGFTFKL